MSSPDSRKKYGGRLEPGTTSLRATGFGRCREPWADDGVSPRAARGAGRPSPPIAQVLPALPRTRPGVRNPEPPRGILAVVRLPGWSGLGHGLRRAHREGPVPEGEGVPARPVRSAHPRDLARPPARDAAWPRARTDRGTGLGPCTPTEHHSSRLLAPLPFPGARRSRTPAVRLPPPWSRAPGVLCRLLQRVATDVPGLREAGQIGPESLDRWHRSFQKECREDP